MVVGALLRFQRRDVGNFTTEGTEDTERRIGFLTAEDAEGAE